MRCTPMKRPGFPTSPSSAASPTWRPIYEGARARRGAELPLPRIVQPRLHRGAALRHAGDRLGPRQRALSARAQRRVAAGGTCRPGRPRSRASSTSPTITPSARARRCENSQRYTFAAQGEALDELVAAASAPFLVAIGSGLGNMLHTTPMIRNIARRTRRAGRCRGGRGSRAQPVPGARSALCERGLFAEAGGAAPLLRHGVRDAFLRRRRASPSTRGASCGRATGTISRPAECTRRCSISKPRGACSAFPTTKSDTLGYFCGDLILGKPSETLVGFHAGSKTGSWTVKRWPHYRRARAPPARARLRVASFGTSDEYVEGTENRTGASIAAMCESMLDCSHFVANDSGVMNIANALGIPTLALFAPTNAADAPAARARRPPRSCSRRTARLARSRTSRASCAASAAAWSRSASTSWKQRLLAADGGGS